MIPKIGQQLPLKVDPVNPQTLGNFLGSEQIKAHLHLLGKNERVYLWGDAGCGKSHLLRACCLDRASQPGGSYYLDLMKQTEAILMQQQFAETGFLAIDNLQVLAGKREQEQALLEAYEAVRKSEQSWLLAAITTPVMSGFLLPDLVSRLESCTVYQLHQPQEQQKRQALQQRARMLGFDLSDPVVDYLMLRSARDMHALFAILDQLDTVSLIEQRKVTVPLLRQLLAANH